MTNDRHKNWECPEGSNQLGPGQIFKPNLPIIWPTRIDYKATPPLYYLAVDHTQGLDATHTTAGSSTQPEASHSIHTTGRETAHKPYYTCTLTCFLRMPADIAPLTESVSNSTVLGETARTPCQKSDGPSGTKKDRTTNGLDLMYVVINLLPYINAGTRYTTYGNEVDKEYITIESSDSELEWERGSFKDCLNIVCVVMQLINLIGQLKGGGIQTRMSGPKEWTKNMKKEKMAEEEANKRKERRSRSGSRDPRLFSGAHDNTMVSSDEEQPSAKVSRPEAEKAATNYRQDITAKYHKRLEFTKKKREAAGIDTQRDDDLEIEEMDKTIDKPTAPLPAPVKHADAPTLRLKDLLPDAIRDEVHESETIKASRLEYILLYRKIEDDEKDAPMEGDVTEYDWSFPNQDTFERMMDEAILQFCDEDPNLLEILDYSNVGWTTGIGILGFRTDNMALVEQFGSIIKSMTVEGLPLRFDMAPRKILMEKYAFTIYFNKAFRKQQPERLMFWLLKFNPTLSGNINVVEVRKYPDNHPNARRAGSKIIAFEGDQDFRDSLFKHPRDHQFSIRFGGKLYVRGGDRIDANDPDAVQSRRFRISKDSIKKLTTGSGQEILDAGMRSEEEAAKAAQERQKRAQDYQEY